MTDQILMPVRYAAWLAGEFGEQILEFMQNELKQLPDINVQKLHRGLLIQSSEAIGPFTEQVGLAAKALEADVAKQFPVFHREMGPVWTGVLQVVFSDA